MTLCPALAGAVEIRGDYVEARNADVFTGPCFSNAEVFIYGKQAVMAWKVNEGTWKGVDLAGLCVAAAVQAETTFSEDNPDKARAVLIVDSRADERQRAALIDMAKTLGGTSPGQCRPGRRDPDAAQARDACAPTREDAATPPTGCPRRPGPRSGPPGSRRS